MIEDVNTPHKCPDQVCDSQSKSQFSMSILLKVFEVSHIWLNVISKGDGNLTNTYNYCMYVTLVKIIFDIIVHSHS